MRNVLWVACCALVLTSNLPAHAADSPAQPLRVVGVLGNSAGMSPRPVPYAYYSGIAVDAQGRIYLAGAAEGMVVCDQDGHCLAVVPSPGGVASLLVRSGSFVFGVAGARDGRQSVLVRFDTRPESAAAIRAERVHDGPGDGALSPTLDRQGRVLLGMSDVARRTYTVVAVEPESGRAQDLFTLEQPQGATRAWRHLIQAEPDGSVCIEHAGGKNWGGRYDLHGQRLGDVIPGQILDDHRYTFNYAGGIRRMDLSGIRSEPGECGSELHENRMARQVARSGDRYFFVGRGGAVEAAWNGIHFTYTRRIGGAWIEDFVDAGDSLQGIAFTADGNQDVQHGITLPKSQPIGQLLHVGRPLHSLRVLAAVPGADELTYLARKGHDIVLCRERQAGGPLEEPLPELRAAGQCVRLGRDLLIADPASGTIWRRSWAKGAQLGAGAQKSVVFRSAKERGFRGAKGDNAAAIDLSALTAWRTDMPGVTGLAIAGDTVVAATAKQVVGLSADGSPRWISPTAYRGIRRLAATPQHVYVCDTAAHVVDQLDAETGRPLARLGVAGEPGAALDRLNHPQAVAADANGVYVADNGNGRVLVATSTQWRPEIPPLPREDNTPITAVRLPVHPPCAGRMSVNVYDTHDLTVRQLACARPSDESVIWDGRDLYGDWATPGEYHYHGIVAPKLSLRYVTSIEQSGTPPYRTADGRGSWGGVWGYVMDICPVSAAPDSDIVVLWAVEEGEGGLIRMSQDGEVRWKQHLDWWMKAQQMAVASDGSSIYIAAASALDAPQGQSNYGGDWNRPLLWRVSAETGAREPFPGTDQQHQRMFGKYLRGDRIVTDVAVAGGKVYLTAPAQDTLFVADARTGEPLAAWPIPQVSGVAIDSRGKMYVGSGRRIVELQNDTGKMPVAPDSELTRGTGKMPVAPDSELARGTGKMPGAPNGRTVVDDAGGPLWDLKITPHDELVASIGGPRQQVVFFDRDGRELRALGKSGGRPRCGKMDPQSFLDPVGLCVTGNGKLFVAEGACPKRFSRWSADGRFERQFHGPYYYSGMFGVDEARPEHVYGDTHGDIIRYVVDYETGRWDVDRYWIGVYHESNVPAKWWPRIRHKDGKTYWCSGSGGIVELRDDGFRGVAAVYGGWVEKQPDGNFQAMLHQKKTGLKGTWSDLNGDGRPQPDEWQVTDRPAYPLSASGPQQGWGGYFDEHFDFYMHDWSDDAAGGVWKIPVSRWVGSTPVYRWEEAQHVGLPLEHGLRHGGSGARTAFAAGGAVYAFNGAYNAANLPGVGHGHDWEVAQITKYDGRSGKPLWHAGQRCESFAAAGQHYCPTGAGGIVDDYLFWTDENSLVHVWDVERGLYVDTLLEDGSRGSLPSPYTVWVELFNTRVFRHPTSGKVYLLAASDAIHVFEVLGLERPPVRFQGTFTLTPEQVADARRQWSARNVPQYRMLGIPRPRGPVTIDGDLSEFAHAPAAEMVLRQSARGTARLMADDRFLYVAWDVVDDSPWKNAGGDTSALFKTGDTLDLWLGPSPGKRPPDVRDVRVLFAPAEKGAIVVAYRPKVEQGARRVPFRSPSGEVWMDRVEVLDDVRVAVKVGRNGYRLEAAIPRSRIGLDADCRKVGLDLSINFSDPAGQRNVARIHWARHGAAMVYDLPSEARFEPETWGEGEFQH
jgi:hypothetical protein